MKQAQPFSVRKRRDDDDGPPSPPRPSSNAVSMESLLALAKQAEQKIKPSNNHISSANSSTNGSNIGKGANPSQNKRNQQNQNKQQQPSSQQPPQNKKRKFDDEEEREDIVAATDGNNNFDEVKKNKNKKRKKNKNKEKNTEVNQTTSNNEEEVVNEEEEADNSDRDDYPYPVDHDDHCESPLEAYQDIKHLLDLHSRDVCQKTAEEFVVYDPYFCEGSVVKRLTTVGYPNVYNRKEDFYQTIRLRAIPSHDVLLTNPPYSSDHMEKLVRFVVSNNEGRPFCLLVPNYVYMKDYFQKIVGNNNSNIFFIVPKKRYLYTTPKVKIL